MNMKKFYAVIWGLIFGLILGAYGLLYSYLLQVGGMEIPSLPLLHKVLLVPVACVLVPLSEEYFFREVLLTWLRTRMRVDPAMLVSALLFMVCHPLHAWPVIFMVGLVAAYSRVRFHHLLPAVVLHGAYNFVVLIFN